MKQIAIAFLVATSVAALPAEAADLPIRTPVVPGIAAFSWTGVYLGPHFGAGTGTKEWTNFQSPVAPPEANGINPGSGNVNGFLGGFQVGANYQIGWAVFGVEGDFSWSNMKGTVACGQGPGCGGGQPFNYDSKVAWLASLTGRIGGTVGSALLYVKGGGAWVSDNFRAYCLTGQCAVLPAINADLHVQQRRGGWTFGTGVEYAFDRHWSGKIEYDYFDFGKATIQFPPSGNALGFAIQGLATDVAQRLHVIKAGLNFRWSGS